MAQTHNYKTSTKKQPVELAKLVDELDELSWGFRIEKMQEINSKTMWHVFFVNPQNITWYSYGNEDLSVSLKYAIALLKTSVNGNNSTIEELFD